MDLVPTAEMAKNAERGLKLRKEYGRGGTEVGVARATQLKNRENLSPDTVRRMVSYFARHQGDNLSEKDPPSAGYIAWLLWGGDAGKAWAERMAKRIDKQKENVMDNSIITPQQIAKYQKEKAAKQKKIDDYNKKAQKIWAESADAEYKMREINQRIIALQLSPDGKVSTEPKEGDKNYKEYQKLVKEWRRLRDIRDRKPEPMNAQNSLAENAAKGTLPMYRLKMEGSDGKIEDLGETEFPRTYLPKNVSPSDLPALGQTKIYKQDFGEGEFIKYHVTKTKDAKVPAKKNSLAQKKLAIIKSNAAPEVKLKALEKLNASKETDENKCNGKKTYYKGDKAEYTGESKEMHGGKFFALKMLEGIHKGKVFWTQHGPDGEKPARGDSERAFEKGVKTPQVEWNAARWVQKGNGDEIYFAAKMQTKRGEIYMTASQFGEGKFGYTVDAPAGKKAGDARSIEQAKAMAEREAEKLAASAYADNAAPDDKLAGPKKALSALLSSLGYAQMSKDVLKETELEKLKPYGRAVLSDMQKQSNPAIKDKLPRVQELLSKLGVL